MLYLESHINVKRGDALAYETAKDIAKQHRMKITVMNGHDHLRNSATREYVITGHSRDRAELEQRMKTVIWMLADCSLELTRYKIEEALLDSRVVDEWNFLEAAQ